MSEVLELASEATSEDSEAWSEWLPKGKLSGLLEVSEKTIEVRVNSGEYQSEKRKGRAFVRVPKASDDYKKISEAHSEDTPTASEEPPNISRSESEITPKASELASEEESKAFDVLSQAFHQVDMYAKELIKAGEERGYYRAITDTHTKTEQTLKDEIFAQAATIKQLEAQQPAIEVLAKVKQLEAQLVERGQAIEDHKIAMDKITQELQALKDEKDALSIQLEAEKKKSLLDKVLGR